MQSSADSAAAHLQAAIHRNSRYAPRSAKRKDKDAALVWIELFRRPWLDVYGMENDREMSRWHWKMQAASALADICTQKKQLQT